MAESIRGINVVIGADTTGLSKALSDVNKRSRDIQSELKQVERLLKLDPSNTQLLAQKQQLLSQAVENTRQKLDRLRAVQEQVNEQFARGEISEGQYRAFQREVVKTEQELQKLEKQLSEVTVEVKDQGEQVSKLGKDYQESFDRAKQSMGNAYDQAKRLGAAVTAAGAAIGAGLGVAVAKAADFEQAMANVFSVMAPDEVKQFSDELENLALVMGADTKYSATEAARGIEELIKAGVSVQDVLEGGLAGALTLATAGELELADAAEIASTVLNAFRDDAISVQEAADILAGAANASATSVQEMRYGLAQVSSVASAVGLSFEDTATALAVFAQNGLKGSDAGTSLKTMLMRLQPDTKEAKGAFEDLGLFVYDTQKAFDWLAQKGITPASTSLNDIRKAIGDYIEKSGVAERGTAAFSKAFDEIEESIGYVRSAFVDANGQFVDLATMADTLRKSMENLTDAQRLQYLQTIFGSDAIRAANILFKEGAEGVTAMADAMSKISAEDVAAQKMDTFKGAIEELNGALETAQISIGSALIPVLRMLTGIVQAVVDGFNTLPPGVQSAVAVIGALVAALALVTGPMLLLVGFLPQIAAGFAMLTPILSSVGAAFTAMTGPVGIAIAAIAAGAALIIANWEPIKGFFTKLWGDISSYLSGVWRNISDGMTKAWNALLDRIRPILEGYKTFFSGVWDAIKNIFAGALLLIIDLVTGDFSRLKKDAEAIWNNLKDAFRRIWDGIRQVFSGALDLLESSWSAAWSSIKSIADNIWQAIKDGIQKAIDWIRGLPSEMLQLGKNIIQGLIDGIKNMVGKVGDAIKSVADKVTGGLRDFLDIRSPSRVLMQLGEYTGEGFVSGLEKTVDAVRREAAEMAAAVTGGLSGLSMPGVAVAGSGVGAARVTNVSMEGLFAGATIVVRSDDDIRAIARELYRLQQNAARGAGL
jgi:phage-related minor tail protein